MEANRLKNGTNGTDNGTNGLKDHLKLALVETEPFVTEEVDPVLRTERDLKLVADKLSESLHDFEFALRAGGRTELGPRLRNFYEELVELQEAAARELGRAVGDRVAALNRWKVRRGIDVAEPRR